MAVAYGVSAGFCEARPSDDPAGTNGTLDGRARAVKDTCPASATTVTEIGFWCDQNTEESNFEVGIYTHDSGNNRPGNLLAGYSQTNAKGTTSGWKYSTGLSIDVSSYQSQTLWICIQLDDTATTTSLNTSNVAGADNHYKTVQTTLPSPWGATEATGTDVVASIYALYSTGASSTPIPVFMNLYRQFKA